MENLRRWPLRGFRRGYGSYGDLPCPLSHISPVAAVAEGSRRTISRHDADTEVAVRFDVVSLLVIGESKALIRHHINCLS